MSSQFHHDHDHGHLDATAGREVVYCHACGADWWRDEHGLSCPRCSSDITEIVSPGNDPRSFDRHASAFTSPEIPSLRSRHGDDSDPDEADIEEHMGPHGFTFRSSVRDNPQDRRHHNPAIEPVLARFIDMLQELSPPRNDNFMERPGGLHDHFGGPHIHRTTIRSGPFTAGTTSFTIVMRGGGSPGDARGDPFQAYAQPSSSRTQQPGGPRFSTISMTIRANQNARIFSDALRDLGPPDDGDRQPGGPEGPEGHGGPPPGFARHLQDILSLIQPVGPMAGDAVYSQEALDRIITRLMEANPQSNAAPPATEEALRSLDRRAVNKEMLGTDGKTECAICIDEMQEGQTAAFLPCKHWFHEECVVLWLKEHNTCPVCRTPIEKNDRNNASRNNNNDSSSGGNGSRSNQSPGAGSPFSPFPASGPGAGSTSWFASFTPGYAGPSGNGDNTQQTRSARMSRPMSQSPGRLGETFRSPSSVQREWERERGERDRHERGTTSGYSYDTSRLQRRSSHSPTSPRATALGDQAGRMRQRSPSESSRRSMADRDGRRMTGGHGPFSWFRDRFGGGGSSRDDRRS